MSKIDLEERGWARLGRTKNSTYYSMLPEVIACVPDEGSTDDGESARENAHFQENHWIQTGHRGTCIVFFDFLADQTQEARKVYTTFPFVNQLGTGLVGGTPLSRAIASFFTGLSRPKTPTRFFASEEEAVTWCLSLSKASRD